MRYMFYFRPCCLLEAARVVMFSGWSKVLLLLLPLHAAKG